MQIFTSSNLSVSSNKVQVSQLSSHIQDLFESKSKKSLSDASRNVGPCNADPAANAHQSSLDDIGRSLFPRIRLTFCFVLVSHACLKCAVGVPASVVVPDILPLPHISHSPHFDIRAVFSLESGFLFRGKKHPWTMLLDIKKSQRTARI